MSVSIALQCAELARPVTCKYSRGFAATPGNGNGLGMRQLWGLEWLVRKSVDIGGWRLQQQQQQQQQRRRQRQRRQRQQRRRRRQPQQPRPQSIRLSRLVPLRGEI